MMKLKFVLAFLVFGLITAMNIQQVTAREIITEFKHNDKIHSLLLQKVGKVVEVVLKSGTRVEGTVASVKQHVVHIKKLKGISYYDAYILKSQISMLIVRAIE